MEDKPKKQFMMLDEQQQGWVMDALEYYNNKIYRRIASQDFKSVTAYLNVTSYVNVLHKRIDNLQKKIYEKNSYFIGSLLPKEKELLEEVMRIFWIEQKLCCRTTQKGVFLKNLSRSLKRNLFKIEERNLW